MDAEAVKDYFRAHKVRDHYVHAATAIGLWASEQKIFTQVFKDKDARLIEIGTGAGRIAFGMEDLGYKHLLAVDLSKEMIKEARRLAKGMESGVVFQVGDATALKFEDNAFDGAIFGFNGLMQIPGRANRIAAMVEIRRVIKPGAWFVFTTHDRENSRHRSYWQEQEKVWEAGKQDPRLDDFGDRYEETPLGQLFIHVPTPNEVRADLKAAGWRIEVDVPRSHIANESLAVREFSDECRFWVVQKPD